MPTFRKFLFFFALALVVVRPSIAADSLVVSPPNPTIMDSIRLSIVMKNWDCCTRYSYDSTAAILSNDSIITLAFKVPEIVMCVDTLCLPGKPGYPGFPVLTYKSGPLPAGNYSVYEVESPACTTGQACPQASLVVIQTLIGKFTVSQSAAVVFHQKPVPLENVGKTIGNGRVYDIRGALVSPNRLGTSRQTPGVYFIKPDERSTAQLKIWY